MHPMRPLVPALATLAAVLTAVSAGCGPTLPPRYVIEREVGDYAYRRYQHVLDVELVVPENRGDGHTAVYVQRAAAAAGEGRDDMHLVSAFVSVYDHAASLAAEVKVRIEELASYEVRVVEREGENVWLLDGGGDRWLLWVSGRFVVKLGAPGGGELPDALVERYLDLYPSDLDEHGRARPGAASAGESQDVDVADEDALPMPR
jgi:hypothetical protein